MLVGTPEQVVAKLRQHAAVGIDLFYYGSFGLPHDFAMRSLALFISKVMPHFTSNQGEATPRTT